MKNRCNKKNGNNISIIVPVFNIALELPRCVQSILQQTYRDFELLLVDDGSTDGSNSICDELAKTDSRIRVIHQKNAGVSVARNMGIEEAKGEYIAFVDGDDVIAPKYLERLFAGIKDETALSMCGHVRISSYDFTFPMETEDIHYYLAKDCAKRLLCGRFPITACCCLMRKSILGDIRFPVGIRSNEDKLFLYRYLLRNENQRIAFTNDAFYGYYIREESASRSNWNGSRDVIEVADEIEILTIKHHPEWLNEARDNTIVARLITLKSIILNERIINKKTHTFNQIRKETLKKGWPKTAGHRTKVEYTCLTIGGWCYRFLVKLFYNLVSDEKRYKTNEKMIRQG